MSDSRTAGPPSLQFVDSDDSGLTKGTTFEAGTPVVLFPTRIYAGGAENGMGRQYDVARDGRFLINTALDVSPRLSRSC